MTKLRPPLSIENALFQVLGRIGIDEAARLTSRSTDYLRSLSDPENRYRLTCEDAMTLDDAHQALTGERPIYETMGLMIEARNATRFADVAALRRKAVSVVLEAGQAHAALVAATCDGAGEKDLLTFIREAEESVSETTGAIAAAKAMLGPRQHPP